MKISKDRIGQYNKTENLWLINIREKMSGTALNKLYLKTKKYFLNIPRTFECTLIFPAIATLFKLFYIQNRAQ